MKDKGIKYPVNKTWTSSCKDGSYFYDFEEKGRFKLDVEVINCCPGISGGVTIQHPNDFKEPSPPGPYEQQRINKGEDYTSTFDAKKGQKVHISCNDIKTTPDTCIFKYSIV